MLSMTRIEEAIRVPRTQRKSPTTIHEHHMHDSSSILLSFVRTASSSRRIPILASVILLLMTNLAGVSSQEISLEEFRTLHNELRQRMDEDPDEARVYLESEIAKQPESEDLQVLRHSLASKLASEASYEEANQQYRKLLDFQISHLDNPKSQFGIVMTVQSIREVAEMSGRDDAFHEAVDQSLTALGQVENTQSQGPLAQLIVWKSHALAADDQVEEAKTLTEKQYARLQSETQKQRTEENTLTLIRYLKAMTGPEPGNDEWREEYIPRLVEACSVALESFPDSPAFQNAHAETQYRMITQWAQADPDEVEERIDSVFKALSAAAVKNRTVDAILRRIEIHRERMSAAKPADSLVGKPAPDWDIDAWANTIGVTRDSLKGQVVLLDFWAIWCGPCIATFPHLREWREEFGDEGFEIVGVTQYYNFLWDEELKRASRAEENVSPADERETLAKFLEHHQLEHPVLVTPKGSEMSGQYGVRGIPHVVLIDREGVVQLVKTGAGEATAKEIHAKIKELVETPSEDS